MSELQEPDRLPRSSHPIRGEGLDTRTAWLTAIARRGEVTNAVAVSLHEPVTVPPFVLLKQNSAKLGQWYELTGEVSVRSALAWAEENVGVFRTFSLYAVFDMPWPGETPRELNSHRVMVRLYGVDPTRNDEDEPRWPTEFYAREQWFGHMRGTSRRPKTPDLALCLSG